MISKRLSEVYGNCVNCGHALGLVPYKWDCSENRMYFVSTRKRKALFDFNCILLAVYQVYISVRFLQPLMEKDSKPVEVLVIAQYMYDWIRYNHLVVCQYLLRKYWGSFEPLFNNLNVVTSKLKAYVPKTRSEPDLVTIRVIYVLEVCIILFPIFQFVAVLNQPDRPYFLSSLFPYPQHLRAGIRVPIALLHVYMMTAYIYTSVLTMISIYVYNTSVVCLLSQLRLCTKAAPAFTWYKRKMSYTSILLLVKNFNTIFGIWVVAVQLVLTFALVLNSFLVVVHGNWRSILPMIGIATGCQRIWFTMGTVHEESSLIIWEWKGIPRKSRWTCKFLAATQSAKVKLGQFGFVDRPLILTVLNTVTSTSATLILAYRYD